MSRRLHDFFESFKEVISYNNSIPAYVSTDYPRLKTYNIDGIDIGPEEIVRIVEGIKEGNREDLNKMDALKEYLQRTLDLIDEYRSDRENEELIYGYGRGLPEDEDLISVPVARFESAMEYNINKVLNVLETDGEERAKFFGYITPSHEMALTSLQRQGITKKNNEKLLLPEQVIKYQIKPFVAKIPKGGLKKRRTRRKKRNNKNKTKYRYNKSKHR
jgi:hypothetical protein